MLELPKEMLLALDIFDRTLNLALDDETRVAIVGAVQRLVVEAHALGVKQGREEVK